MTAASVGLWLTGCGDSGGGASLPDSGDPVLRIGYIPITDAAPLLIGHAKGFFEEEGVRVERPTLIRGWSTLAEAFLSRKFNLVHQLIPMPIYQRFAGGHRVKVVAWNHMNGSALTVGMGTKIGAPEDLGGKQIAVPYWYSIHNIILQGFLREYGLEAVIQPRGRALAGNQTNLFVMKPPDMPTAMAGGDIDGYIVAEPFNASGETLAGGKIIRFTGDAFRNHPCCVACMHEGDLDASPQWAQSVLNGLVKAQAWIVQNREEAAFLLSKDGEKYLLFDRAVIERAMLKYDLETYGVGGGTGAIRHPDWGVKRIGFNPYPYESTTREIVRLLKNTLVEGDAAFLGSLDEETVVRELFEYSLVKNAVEANGGLGQFDGVASDTPDPYTRQEVIAF